MRAPKSVPACASAAMPGPQTNAAAAKPVNTATGTTCHNRRFHAGLRFGFVSTGLLNSVLPFDGRGRIRRA